MATRRNFNHALLAGVGFALLGGREALAQRADLNLTPKRVVFPPTSRAATVYVFNRGTGSSTYVVELVDRVMTAEGSIRSLADLAEDAGSAVQRERLRSARSFVTYSPRRFTLMGGESQTLRLRVARPADLPEGEYRTHLTVTQMPPPESGVTPEQATSSAPNAIAISMTALYSASIPLIVRQGAAAASAGIAKVGYEPGPSGAAEPKLVVELIRDGAASVYGDLVVRPLGDTKPASQLGVARGIGVYPEIDRRPVRIPLKRPLARGEQVEVLFIDDDQRAGQTLASARYAAT